MADAVAHYIQLYGTLLAQQIEAAGGWPKQAWFPEPTTPVERTAMRLFLREVENTTGMTVSVTDNLP